MVAVEEPFSLPILDPGTGKTLEPVLVGVFDLVERDETGTIALVDFKTTTLFPRPGPQSLDCPFQMSCRKWQES